MKKGYQRHYLVSFNKEGGLLLGHLHNREILNIALFIIIVATLTFVFYLHGKWKKSANLIKDKKTRRIGEDSKAFKSLKEQLHVVLLFKNKENLFKPIYSLLLVFFFIVFLYFLAIKHLILAIALPAIMYFFTVLIIKQFIVTFDDVVRSNFPMLANHMAKMFSGTSDLSIVLYESSKEIDEPLRSLILKLSRELMVDNSERVLINFISESKNMWLHSFVFTLVNYKETSSKEDIVENLLTLSELIENRKDISEKMTENRKPVVIINYMLLIVGIVIFIGNFIANPIFKPFLFTFLGTFSMIAGVSAIFITIIINLRFTKID